MAPFSKAASVICLILAIASICSAVPIHPVGGLKLVSRSLDARAPIPRIIPGGSDTLDGNAKSDVVHGVLHSLGLDTLNQLNSLEFWKAKMTKEGVIDDSQNTRPSETTSHNSMEVAEDTSSHESESDLRNPSTDPLGFAIDMFTLVSNRIKEAADSSDERTLN